MISCELLAGASYFNTICTLCTHISQAHKQAVATTDSSIPGNEYLDN